MFASKRSLKGWFSKAAADIIGLNAPYSLSLQSTGIGYKVFTPKSRRFLSSIVLKMGFGGNELAFKIPSDLRIRARRQKIVMVGLDKSLLATYAHNLKALKYPGTYTGKGLRFRNEKIVLKKRKQQQKGK